MYSIKVKRWVHTLSVVVLGLAAQVAQADRVYIANASSTVSVVEVSNNSLVATIPVGRGPTGVAANPAGTRVYVANTSAEGNGSVSVIDTNTNTVIATIVLATSPLFIAVNQTGTRAYVTSEGDNTVSMIDTNTNTVISTVTTGAGSINVPYQLAINPDGTRLYVTLRNTNLVSVIDTSNDQLSVLKNVVVESSPVGVMVNPAGTLVYVANKGTGTISMIDTMTNNNIGKVVTHNVCVTAPNAPPDSICVMTPAYDISGSVQGLVSSPNGQVIYLTNPYDITVKSSNMSLASYGGVPIGNSVIWIALDSTGTRLYATNSYDNTVVVIDTATMSSVAVLTSANANISWPRGVAVIHR